MSRDAKRVETKLVGGHPNRRARASVNRIRVLFVINGLGTGGAERSLSEALPLLAGSGVDPVIVCLFHREQGVEHSIIEAGFDVRFLRSKNTLSRMLELRRIARSEEPEIIHTSIFESDLLGRLSGVGQGSAVISSLVNTSYAAVRLQDPNVRRFRLRVARTIDGWTARHLTTHFHAITHAAKRSAIRYLGVSPERITVIERGRDPARLGEPSRSRREAARARLGLAANAEVLVNVGRHEFQKGQRYLIDAMNYLCASRPRVVLLVAGRRGNASVELEGRIRGSGLEDRIQLLGHREDVPEILAAADVFVFSSLYEGLGGALIEAMALGLPIVSTGLEAIREVVEQDRNAVLVPPASSTELAAAMARLLNKPGLRSAFGGRSRKIFSDRFTLRRSTERLVELYRQIVAGNGG